MVANVRQELLATLRQDVLGTPYLLTETSTGFILEFNLLDKQWWWLLQKRGAREVFRIVAKLNEADMRITLNDEISSIRWEAGGVLPKLSYRRNWFSGTAYSFRFAKEYGQSSPLSAPGLVVNYFFNSSAMKEWLRSRYEPRGWRLKMSGGTLIGAVTAVSALALTIITFAIAFLY